MCPAVSSLSPAELLDWAFHLWQAQGQTQCIQDCLSALEARTPPEYERNANYCGSLVSSLATYRQSGTVAILGGLQATPQYVHSLREQVGFFVFAGNQTEQTHFQQAYPRYRELNFHFLPPSLHTREEAEKLVTFLCEHRIGAVRVMTYDITMTRALLTLLATCRQQGVRLQLLPYPCLDHNRLQMPAALIRLGILVEAHKLWEYQQKGDVATWEEAFQTIKTW